MSARALILVTMNYGKVTWQKRAIFCRPCKRLGQYHRTHWRVQTFLYLPVPLCEGHLLHGG